MSDTASPDPSRRTAEPTAPVAVSSKSTPPLRGHSSSSPSQQDSSRPQSRDDGGELAADVREGGRIAVPTTTIPDDPDSEGADLPLPLSASLVLTTLPQDASEALETATREWSSGVGVPDKVTIRFQAIGSAPQLRQKIFKVASKNRFETVVAFLSKKLGTSAGSSARTQPAPVEASRKESSSTPSKSPDAAAAVSSTKKHGKEDATVATAGVATAGEKVQGQVFCYVNSVFAPALDEGVGALWKCFKTDDALTVAYSMTPAFG